MTAVRQGKQFIQTAGLSASSAITSLPMLTRLPPLQVQVQQQHPSSGKHFSTT